MISTVNNLINVAVEKPLGVPVDGSKETIQASPVQIPSVSIHRSLPANVAVQVAKIVEKASSVNEVVRLIDEAFPAVQDAKGVWHYSKYADYAVNLWREAGRKLGTVH